MDPRGTNCFSAIVEDKKRLVATTSTCCRSEVSGVRGQTCRGVVLLHTSLWSWCLWRRKGQRLTIYAISHPLWSILPSCNEMHGSSNDWLPHLALYVPLRSCNIIHIASYPSNSSLNVGCHVDPKEWLDQGACWLHLYKIHIPGTQIDGLIAFLALITSILMLDVSTTFDHFYTCIAIWALMQFAESELQPLFPLLTQLNCTCGLYLNWDAIHFTQL